MYASILGAGICVVRIMGMRGKNGSIAFAEQTRSVMKTAAPWGASLRLHDNREQHQPGMRGVIHRQRIIFRGEVRITKSEGAGWVCAKHQAHPEGRWIFTTTTYVLCRAKQFAKIAMGYLLLACEHAPPRYYQQIRLLGTQCIMCRNAYCHSVPNYKDQTG